MNNVLAYLRTSTDKQDLNNQKLELLEYARRNEIHINDFIAISASAQQSHRERRIDDLLAQLSQGDTLIVTELSRLGRSTGEVITLIDHLIAQEITIRIIKQNLILHQAHNDLQSLTMVTMLSLFAQLERSLISQRTKAALAAKKAQGVPLGKPKGTLQHSIYDQDRQRIIELLSYGLSGRYISAHHLGYGCPSSLNYYIQTRKLREVAAKRKTVS